MIHENRVLEYTDIEKLIPHRAPFLLIDKLTNAVPGESATGIKAVSGGESFFAGHFPDKPVMPGVLIIEAMAQAAGVLGFMTMNKTPEEGSIYYFAGADKVRFKKPVLPGETIDLFASINSVKSGIWKFDCYSEVNKSRICSATILCADRPK